MRAFLRGRCCFCSSLDTDESSLLSKGRLRRETLAAGTSDELIDARMVVASVGPDLRVRGGSMIRIFLRSNPSGE